MVINLTMLKNHALNALIIFKGHSLTLDYYHYHPSHLLLRSFCHHSNI